MKKDIVVFIPSRTNPKSCEKTFQLLYTTASDSDNFDIVCIVDDDETKMYSTLISKYPEVIWKHPPHLGPNSRHINKIIFETVENGDYYFNWHIVDDVSSLSKNWDSSILKLKGIYSDGFFSCFSSNPMSRNLNAMNSCFTAPSLKWINGYGSPLVNDPIALIYHYHELTPICTKKWRSALRSFYEEDYTGPDIVFLNASLIFILAIKYCYSRHIQVDLVYNPGIDSNRSSKVMYKGLSRDDFFYEYAQKEKFKMIFPVAKKVSEEIWQYYRDVMDKPRAIGKYAV